MIFKNCCSFLKLEMASDPYDPNEADPMKSKAMESSLWEIKVILLKANCHCLNLVYSEN